MKIALASDHAGIPEREALAEHLRGRGHEVTDFGVEAGQVADYPDQAEPVARAVASGDAERGVLVCGTGIGICMAAGKVDGIRAATIGDAFSAEMARRHNDANIACFGSRVLSTAAMQRFVDIFLETSFDGGRHERRVGKIMALEDASGPVPS